MMRELTRCIFSGMQILSENRWLPQHALVVEDGRIKAIIPDEMIHNHLPAARHTFSSDHYLVPGFIDLHVHGAAGFDVMDGTPEALTNISHALIKEGVTGFLATTMTASDDQIETVLRMMPDAMKDASGAAILGVHLEGPFISRAKMGAQSGEAVQVPDRDKIRQWQRLAQGAIKMVTLAPDLPKSIDFIKTLREIGVIASVGHTDASYNETCEAIEAGCTHATHLFNAMRGMHQRDPGAAGALLLSDNIMAELIVDGVHLHPGMVELAWRVKGKDRLLLVTDAMRAKCMGDGMYDLGGQSVMVKDNKAALQDGTLAGSVLRMPQAVKNMVDFTSSTLIEAVQLAAGNPARSLGLSARKGAIAPGMDADLVVLDACYEATLTMRGGKVIFQK